MTIQDHHKAAAGTNTVICDVDMEALKALSGKKGYMAAEEAIHTVLRADFSPAEKAHTLTTLAEIMATKDSGTLEELKVGRELPWNAAMHAAGGNVKIAEILFQMTIGMMKSESPEAHLGIWAHQVCHLFEEYGSTWAPPGSLATRRTSMLQDREFFRAAEILLNETAKRLEALGADATARGTFVGNLDRILIPLMQMNIDRFIGAQDWRLLPASLNCAAVLNRVDDLQKAFFSSPTPEDFYTALTTRDFANIERYPRQILDRLIDFCISYGDGGAAIPAFLTTDHKEDDKKPTIDVVVYDVDGTLLGYNGNHDLNLHVYNQLMADIAAGENVEIRTGGKPEDQKPRLDAAFIKAGVANPGLAVQSKHDLKDLKVKKLVDDTTPFKQDFRAVTWVHPDALLQPLAAATPAAPALKQP